MLSINDLVGLSTKFVELHKGKWEHNDWLDFLVQVQKQGFDVNDELKSYLGSQLEALKSYYNTVSSTSGIQDAMSKVTNESIRFVTEKKGAWNHEDWEEFIGKLKKGGVTVNDEATAYVGGIVEASKKLYNLSFEYLKETAQKVAAAATPTKE